MHTSKEKDFPNFTPKGKPNRVSLTSLPTPTQSDGNAAHSTPKPKPMKRVVPTRIVGNNNEFNCPAFRSDNNILELPHEENNDSTRDILKSQKDIIRRVFQEERPTNETTNLRAFLQENFSSAKTMQTKKKSASAIDLNRITNKLMLDRFIDIYSIVLDLNLITNILTEISFLLNLINADVDEYYEHNPHMSALSTTNSINDQRNAIESTLGKINVIGSGGSKQKHQRQPNHKQQDELKRQQQQPPLSQQTKVDDCDVALNELSSSTCATADDVDTNAIAASLLKNINNCVYFGLGVLQLQKNVLRLLDMTSIKVLLENERLTTLAATIKDDLTNVYSHKMQLELSLHSHDTSSAGYRSSATQQPLLQIQNSSMKVFYQQEQDTQINFPTSREFATFKKQRDTFYSILG